MSNKCNSINVTQCTKITKKVSFYKITISIRITILTLDTYFFQNRPNPKSEFLEPLEIRVETKLEMTLKIGILPTVHYV